MAVSIADCIIVASVPNDKSFLVMIPSVRVKPMWLVKPTTCGKVVFNATDIGKGFAFVLED